MAKTVYKQTKAIARNAAVTGKPGGKKISKTKITGMPVKRKRK
jgi:hypothetical protein|tara:strand:- start:1779 stop:1907 length:129 start_codon:yes stop_codon:yes gene_type:complete